MRRIALALLGPPAIAAAQMPADLDGVEKATGADGGARFRGRGMMN